MCFPLHTTHIRSAALGRTRSFHPWAHEPEGWSGACVSVSHVVGHRQGSGFDGLGWVTLEAPVRARQGPVWVRISVVHQYKTIERSIRACRGLPGHVGFRRVSVGTLIWHDMTDHMTRRGSTDRSTVPYRCTIDVRTHTGPYGVPMGPPGPRWDPMGPRRTAGGTIGPCFIGASRFGRPAAPIGAADATCTVESMAEC